MARSAFEWLGVLLRARLRGALVVVVIAASLGTGEAACDTPSREGADAMAAVAASTEASPPTSLPASDAPSASSAPVATAAPPSAAVDAATDGGLVFGQRVTLSGKLVLRDMMGLVHGGVEPVKIPFLLLDARIDVASAGDNSINDATPQRGVKEVQVGFNDIAKARASYGKHVKVQGELSPQITAYHLSPVLLLLADLQP